MYNKKSADFFCRPSAHIAIVPFSICADQLRRTVVSPRFYVALLIGVVMQILAAMPLVDFAEKMGSNLELFEIFIYFNCDDYTASTAALAVFLLVFDIPFSDVHEAYTLLRTTRRHWLLGKLCYIFCICFAYYFLLSAFGMLYMLGNISIENEWSYPIMLLTRDTSMTLSEAYSVFFLYSYIPSSMTPLCSYIASLLLSVAYAVNLCLLLFLLTLKMQRAMGFFLTILVHIVGYTFSTILNTSFFVRLSLFGASLLMYHNYGTRETKPYFSVPQALMLYLCLGLTLCAALSWAIRDYDFRDAP